MFEVAEPSPYLLMANEPQTTNCDKLEFLRETLVANEPQTTHCQPLTTKDQCQRSRETWIQLHWSHYATELNNLYCKHKPWYQVPKYLLLLNLKSAESESESECHLIFPELDDWSNATRWFIPCICLFWRISALLLSLILLCLIIITSRQLKTMMPGHLENCISLVVSRIIRTSKREYSIY